MTETKQAYNFTDLPRPEVELSGIDGNAFVILGAVRQALRKNEWPKEAIDELIEEAMSGNYDHLLQTVCKHLDVS